MSLAIFDFINSILLPKYCILCGTQGQYICTNCLKIKFKVNFNDICHVCGNVTFTKRLHKECEDSTNLNKLFFFCEYNLASKRLIEEIKYKGNYAIIEDLALHMSKYLQFKVKNINTTDFIVTSVPSHIFKKNQRGFNQSELLARKVAGLLGFEYKTLLKKNKNTKKQAGSTKNSRSQNLRDTFSAKIENVSKNVIIIDDVHTTGSTLNECAGILAKVGAKTIYGYTFAKSLNYSSARA